MWFPTLIARSVLQQLCRTVGLLSLPFAGGHLLLRWPPRVLRAITWGRAVESISSIHLLRQFSVWSYYFLAFHDSQASQCCLNQPSINIFLKHSFVFVSTAVLSKTAFISLHSCLCYFIRNLLPGLFPRHPKVSAPENSSFSEEPLQFSFQIMKD